MQTKTVIQIETTPQDLIDSILKALEAQKSTNPPNALLKIGHLSYQQVGEVLECSVTFIRKNLIDKGLLEPISEDDKKTVRFKTADVLELVGKIKKR